MWRQRYTSHRGGVCLLAAIAVLCAGVAFAVIPAAATTRPPPTRDTAVSATAARAPLARLQRIQVRGGVFNATRHERVGIYRWVGWGYSRPVLQAYAKFLGSLWHGRELSLVTVYVVTYRQMSSVCGDRAGACYQAHGDLIVVAGPTLAATGDETLAHEYGHHIANYRDNSPWYAMAWGPKRWATYENVCHKARKRRVFPGDEGDHYGLNPGEGWAGVYAYATGHGFNDAFSYWYPNKRARQLIKEDVEHPWAGNTTLSHTGRLAHRATASTVWKSPLDGSLRITLHSPQGTAFKLSLNVQNAIVRTSANPGDSQSLGYTICGTRHFGVEVTATRGSGTYVLSVSRP